MQQLEMKLLSEAKLHEEVETCGLMHTYALCDDVCVCICACMCLCVRVCVYVCIITLCVAGKFERES